MIPWRINQDNHYGVFFCLLQKNHTDLLTGNCPSELSQIMVDLEASLQEIVDLIFSFKS